MMKYLIALSLFFVPLQAEITPEMEKDIDTLVGHMSQYFSENSEKILRAWMEFSTKKMDIQDLSAKIQNKINEPNFSQNFYPLFQELYTPEQLSQIRRYYEEDAFQVYVLNCSEQHNKFYGKLYEWSEAILDQYGTGPSEVKAVDSQVLHLTGESIFSAALELSKGPLIVDIYGDDCAPCKMLEPIFEAVSSEYPEIRFVKMNGADAKDIATKYNIRAVPALLFFKDGKEVGRNFGYLKADELKELIAKYFP